MPVYGRFTVLVALITLVWVGTGCKVDKSADANTKYNTGTITDDMPAPPEDARYTIMCRSFVEDPDHIQHSRLARLELSKTTGVPNKWYVVHSDDHSTLYYGFYRSMDPRDPVDGAEGQRALDDLNKLRLMCDSQAVRLFPTSLLVGLDSPDPTANPAWDITRSPGVWSIEIASSTGPDRKVRTVDAVREARSQGIEAYYYHGENASSVCIGSWPEEAVTVIDPRTQNTDPTQQLVATVEPVSPAESAEMEKNHLKAVAPQVDIQDPTVLQTMHKFPEHSTNGMTMMRPAIDTVTHQQTTAPEHSFLFRIPHRDADAILVNSQIPPAPQPAVQNTEPVPGAGQLRSLGD